MKYFVTEAEINEIIETRKQEFEGFVNIYGIPRGGTHVVKRIQKLFNIPSVAEAEIKPKETLIVDDLIDSGRTMAKYKEQGFDHFVLFNKTEQPEFKDKWLVFPWEKDETIEENIVRVLEYIGEDPNRGGLLETPKRVIKAYGELFSGYEADLKSTIKTFDSENYDQMIVIKDIDYFSHCEHHMVPFFGRVHIGYIPNGKVLGLSKFARIVEAYSRRLQIQERMTKQIAEFIQEELKPVGVIVVVEGTHLCMVMRGVKKINSKTITSEIKGVFRQDASAKEEFLNLIK